MCVLHPVKHVKCIFGCEFQGLPFLGLHIFHPLLFNHGLHIIHHSCLWGCVQNLKFSRYFSLCSQSPHLIYILTSLRIFIIPGTRNVLVFTTTDLANSPFLYCTLDVQTSCGCHKVRLDNNYHQQKIT